ncbi:protein LOW PHOTOSYNTHETIC EFFICIENCY 1, chloroplastic-like [Macadamia integrifolia]|uniref:protein LOW PHOTOSYNTHETIC EFFICIENCY 1, chloroplastic-like n=1 Tax=Macadamia integrifolia TaxID=60698 RepID=UPI001C4F433D|nr:protein LOW PHOTOSYNTHETIC EFFICIENCY 1, chloroplastic-like [Macadamia integrifolia]
MEALSFWFLKGDFSATPYWEFDVGYSCISKTRKTKRRWPAGNAVRQRRSSHHLFASITHRRWDPKCDASYGFFTNHSKLNFVSVCEPSRISSCASFAFGSAFEQQEIGKEFSEESPNPRDSLLNKSDNEEEGSLDIVEGKDGGVFPIKEGGRGDCDYERVVEGKNARIDVRALAWSLRYAKTMEDIDDVLKDFSELPLPVYSSMIRGFGKEKRLEPAVALVEWLKSKKETNGFSGPNLFIYNSLLGAVKQSEQFGEVEKVMEDIAEEGILPNVVTYNTLMAIYLEQGQCLEALNVLKEIEEKGLSPSPVSYSTALQVYRKMEDGSGALDFFVELREKYQKEAIGKDGDNDWETEFINLENFTIRICYQVMRQWLVKGDNSSSNALKLLTEMNKAGMRPGRAEHERLAWACTLEGHYMVAKELYNRIREEESDISLSVCNHIIWVMGKAKKWWAALEIYEDLLDKGPKPNNLSHELIVSHFNFLLTAARRKGIWRWGIRLLNKMEEKGLKPGSREWNSVLVACSKASETSAAVQIFRRMVEQGEKPTIVSYGALLSALEKGKLYDEALQVWEHMLKVGVVPNLYAFTIMASIYAGQGRSEMVDSIIRDMVSSGIEPTVVTFNAIISGCARNSMGSTAFEWFHRMKVLNFSPNEITYEMLIEALAKDAKPKLAYELYLRANSEGFHLSSKAYDAVIYSSRYHGENIDESILGPRPAEKKKNVKIRKTLSEFCNLADVPRRCKPFEREELYTQQTHEN